MKYSTNTASLHLLIFVKSLSVHIDPSLLLFFILFVFLSLCFELCFRFPCGFVLHSCFSSVFCEVTYLDADDGKTAASMPVSNTETRDKSMSEADLKYYAAQGLSFFLSSKNM